MDKKLKDSSKKYIEELLKDKRNGSVFKRLANK